MSNENQVQEKERRDLAAQHQAYSHLSRMHSSLAATFFATLLAYISYIMVLKRTPLPKDTVALCVLYLIPLPVLVVQGLKYYATNMAFRECAKEIKYPKTNLHDYLFSRTEGLYSKEDSKGDSKRKRRAGVFWLDITQGLLGWVLLIVFTLAVIISVISYIPQA